MSDYRGTTPTQRNDQLIKYATTPRPDTAEAEALLRQFAVTGFKPTRVIAQDFSALG